MTESNSQPKWFATSLAVWATLLSLLPNILAAYGQSIADRPWQQLIQTFSAGFTVLGVILVSTSEKRTLTPPPSSGTGSGPAAMLLLPVMLLSLVACSNLTPRQVEKIDTGIFLAGDGLATAGIRTGKVPPAAAPGVISGVQALGDKLTALRAWIAANPNLANVVGMTPPELTATSAAADLVSEYIWKYSLVVPIPAPIPPTTGPSH